jgi:hypothetical protein
MVRSSRVIFGAATPWGNARTSLVIAVLATISASMPAQAGFKTGNDLFSWCSATRPDPDFDTKWGECVGYILGAADSVERATSGSASLSKQRWARYAIP